jgi:ribosomal protein S18 acetylase RimI-like enzyme
MPLSPLQRFRRYHRLHGTTATLRRILAALHRMGYAGKNVLFVCELPVSQNQNPFSLGVLERKSSLSALTAEDVERIVSPADSSGSRQRMNERFSAQAELWLIRCQGVIAAFGWTIQGKTMEPHFVRMEPRDVHLFDFFVFPEFRGRGLNPSLVSQILQAISRENLSKAFIEAAAWNKPQLSSLKKTPFRRLGEARKFQLGKKPLVLWSRREQA